MKLFSLIHVGNPTCFDSCTLSFSTLRVGFPTANITLFINGTSLMKDEIRKKAARYDLPVFANERKDWFHADFIEQVVATNASGVLYQDNDDRIVICDGDIIFWKNCENLFIKESDNQEFYKPRGMYIPKHLNEWSKCVSMPRIHSSFFMVPSCRALLKQINLASPRRRSAYRGYLGHKPFHPTLIICEPDYQPIFYDTLANLGVQCFNFSSEELNYYSHLNSASFYDDVVYQFADAKDSNDFVQIHKLASSYPEGLQGLNHKVLSYYHRRAALLPSNLH